MFCCDEARSTAVLAFLVFVGGIIYAIVKVCCWVISWF